MAETVLLYRPVPTSIDALVLDASVSEQHAAGVDVTEHAVEEGSPVTDNARPRPETVTIEGLFSNTPASIEATNRAAQKTALTTYEHEGSQVAGALGYADACMAELYDLKDNPRLIDIVTQFRAYSSMILTDISVPRDARTGDAIRFTATFKQVRMVRNRMTSVPVTKEPKGKGKQNLGKVEAKKVAPPKRLESRAHRGLAPVIDAAADLLGNLGF